MTKQIQEKSVPYREQMTNRLNNVKSKLENLSKNQQLLNSKIKKLQNQFDLNKAEIELAEKQILSLERILQSLDQ